MKLTLAGKQMLAAKFTSIYGDKQDPFVMVSRIQGAQLVNEDLFGSSEQSENVSDIKEGDKDTVAEAIINTQSVPIAIPPHILDFYDQEVEAAAETQAAIISIQKGVIGGLMDDGDVEDYPEEDDVLQTDPSDYDISSGGNAKAWVDFTLSGVKKRSLNQIGGRKFVIFRNSNYAFSVATKAAAYSSAGLGWNYRTHRKSGAKQCASLVSEICSDIGVVCPYGGRTFENASGRGAWTTIRYASIMDIQAGDILYFPVGQSPYKRKSTGRRGQHWGVVI